MSTKHIWKDNSGNDNAQKHYENMHKSNDKEVMLPINAYEKIMDNSTILGPVKDMNHKVNASRDHIEIRSQQN